MSSAQSEAEEQNEDGLAQNEALYDIDYNNSDLSSDSRANNEAEQERQQWMIERELVNERKYRALYTSLLQKKRESILKIWNSENSRKDEIINTNKNSNHEMSNDYKNEREIIDAVITSERNAILGGAVFGLCVFVSLRYISKPILVYLDKFNKQRNRSLSEKLVNKSKHSNVKTNETADSTSRIPASAAFIVEAGFSYWSGYRAYQYFSHNTDNPYEMISNIPLCEGKSAISDQVCPEWINISKNDVPFNFWKNLDQRNPTASYKRLQDEKAWNAILQFSNNCIKRKVYEKQVLLLSPSLKYNQQKSSKGQDHGDSSQQEQEENKSSNNIDNIALPTRVPDDIIPLSSSQVLNKEEIENFLNDS